MTPIVDVFTREPDKSVAALGEIMLRLAAPGYSRLLQTPEFVATFGGGESNVAVSLAQQGFSARFITALPENDIGEAALRALRGYGVDVSQVMMRPGTRMGLYYLEKGANQRPSKVIYDREGTAISTLTPEDIDFSSAFEGCRWLHITGITPALSRNAADLSLTALQAAKQQGLVVSMDLNYRAKLWNYGVAASEVMKELAGYADIIIANEEDCQKSLGIGADIDHSAITEESYTRLLGQVFSAYPEAAYVAITLRESISASYNRWGACIGDGNDIYFSKKYEITDIVDRVGGGDSFCAGLIAGISTMAQPEEALEYAVAASCLNHSIEGDVNLSTRKEIMALYGGDGTGRIQR